jgi:hypothetical protein
VEGEKFGISSTYDVLLDVLLRYTVACTLISTLLELTDISPHFHLVTRETHFPGDTDFSFLSYLCVNVTSWFSAAFSPPSFHATMKKGFLNR